MSPRGRYWSNWLLAPLVNLGMRKRVEQDDEDPIRFGERQGYPSRPRPPGHVVWVHAAGESEAMSALTLIEGILRANEHVNVLLTSETGTSAKLIQERLPKRAVHQYLPYDQGIAIDNFLDHWHPDGAVWVESEFWPNLVTATRALGIPMLLINARISEDSFHGWRRAPDLMRDMLACFDLCVAQSLPDVGRLATLGAENAVCVGNLKAAAPPLPADVRVVDRLRRSIGERPVWLAAATDPGEESAVAKAHIRAREDFPGLLTIVAPLDPSRGEGVTNYFRRQRLTVTRRSGLEPIRPESEIYVADTAGDMGIFYRLARIVFVGGSLVEQGGHNPLEAASLDSALICGPHMYNYDDLVRDLIQKGAATVVENAAELGEALLVMLADPEGVRRGAEAGLAFVAGGSDVLDDMIREISPYLMARYRDEEAVEDRTG